MEKVYIVTAKNAADAARKIKELRAKDAKACDEPVIYPDESVLKYFIEDAKRKTSIDISDLAAQPDEVLERVGRVAYDLGDSTTSANIWWDMKKLIERGDDENIDKIIDAYKEMIGYHKELADRLRNEAEKVKSDAVKKKVIRWADWYDDKINAALNNIAYNKPFFVEKVQAKKEAEKRKAAEAAKKTAPREVK